MNALRDGMRSVQTMWRHYEIERHCSKRRFVWAITRFFNVDLRITPARVGSPARAPVQQRDSRLNQGMPSRVLKKSLLRAL